MATCRIVLLPRTEHLKGGPKNNRKEREKFAALLSFKEPTGDWLPSVFTGDSQHVTFEGLTPGAIYTAQVRALGGSTGQSDWSDPSSTWRSSTKPDCRLQSAADTAAPYSNIDSQGARVPWLLCFARTRFEKNLNFFENFASQIPEKAGEYVY